MKTTPMETLIIVKNGIGYQTSVARPTPAALCTNGVLAG
jgi:hypothetical protein